MEITKGNPNKEPDDEQTLIIDSSNRHRRRCPSLPMPSLNLGPRPERTNSKTENYSCGGNDSPRVADCQEDTLSSKISSFENQSSPINNRLKKFGKLMNRVKSGSEAGII